MKIRNSTLLQLPSGASGLFLQDARVHQDAVASLNHLYARWGYLPVHTPMADYSRVYQEMIGDDDARKVYHLVDRDGEVLVLRWDITAFLVKQLRSLVPPPGEVLRVSYADSIMRHEDTEDISHNEYFQTGAEIIGREGPDGDLEAMMLMWSALQNLGLKPAIHAGNHRILDLAGTELDEAGKEALAQAVRFRDRAEILRLLSGRKDAEGLAELFCLICPVGNAGASLDALKDRIAPDVMAEARILESFLAQAGELEPGADLHMDLSELGSQNYHSGMVFTAYLPGLSVPAAAGGRYDRLLERMGCLRPATGFSIMLSRLLPLLNLQEAPVEDATGDSFNARYRRARDLRNAGKRVRL